MYREYLIEFWYSAKALKNFKVSFSIPTGGIYGEVGVNTFRNVIGAHYLPHSSEYVAPPSIDVVRHWFPTIRYREEVSAKGTLRKSLLPPRWSVNNWALKPNQPEEPTFTDYMLAICSAAKPVVFKAPKFSSNAERVSQGTKPQAQPGHKKHSTSLKQPSISSKEATKGGSSKALTSSKTGHSKKRKESSSAIDSNLSQTLVSIPVDTGIHKEDQQATGGPTSLGVTSEERANPHLSSGCNASADSTAEADPGLSALNNSIPQQQGMDEGTKNTSFDHISAGTNPHVLADQTQSASEGFKDLDSLEDDLVIVVDNSDEDEEDEVHTTTNAEIEDTSVPKSSSPSLLLNVTKALNKFAQVLDSALSKARDQSVPSVGQADTMLVEGEKNTNQETISQLF
ncbi:hypothetical protein Tco_1359241 [Tanacetum coccineum]